MTMESNELNRNAKKKEDKHILLHNQIMDMDRIIERCEHLLNKIVNNSDKVVPRSKDYVEGEDAISPSLSMVLCNAHESIRKKNEAIHSLLNALNDALYA